MEAMMQSLEEEAEKKKMGEIQSPAPQPRWGANLRAAIVETASRVTVAVASAQELLRDPTLRRKGAAFIVSRAQEGLQAIGKQISSSFNKQQLAVLLSRLESQIGDYQRMKQIREHRRMTVDVQIGPEVYCGVPQEVRCRLWMALLENPALAEPFRPIQRRHIDPGSSLPSTHLAVLGAPAALVKAVGAPSVTLIHQTSPDLIAVDGQSPPSTQPSASACAAPPVADLLGDDLTSSEPSSSTAAVAVSMSQRSGLHAADLLGSPFESAGEGFPAPPNGAFGIKEVAFGEEAWAEALTGAGPRHQAPSFEEGIIMSGASFSGLEWGAFESGVLLGEHSPSVADAKDSIEMVGLAGSRDPDPASRGDDGVGGIDRIPPAGSEKEEDEEEEEEEGDWEVLPEGSGHSGINGLTAASGKVQELLKRILSGSEAETSGNLTGGSGKSFSRLGGSRKGALIEGAAGEVAFPLSDEERRARGRLVQAMLDVPWSVEDGGVPVAYSEDSRFAILNDMTAGQEEIDDIIKRDMHRTFPEHPLFSSEAGQGALFRVLKAYSLHDLEVGYCQGMAFAAGILLMYLPEEPAFRLFCRLMDPEGPGLRRMYTNTLEALKLELARFEVLLSQLHPSLFAHIQVHGVPSVLYVSQWLMTLYATPFPTHFSARVIDVMLQDGNDCLLMRVALAIMEELEPQLMKLDDFELLVTGLKVTPAKWGLSMLRKIMTRALASPISDAQLDEAGEIAAAQLAASPSRALMSKSKTLSRGASCSSKGTSYSREDSSTSTRQMAEVTGGGGGGTIGDGFTLSGNLIDLDDAMPSMLPSRASNKDKGGGIEDLLGLRIDDDDDEGGGSPSGLLMMLSEGQGYSPLDIDEEYMKMILELDLLTPSGGSVGS